MKSFTVFAVLISAVSASPTQSSSPCLLATVSTVVQSLRATETDKQEPPVLEPVPNLAHAEPSSQFLVKNWKMYCKAHEPKCLYSFDVKISDSKDYIHCNGESPSGPNHTFPEETEALQCPGNADVDFRWKYVLGQQVGGNLVIKWQYEPKQYVSGFHYIVQSQLVSTAEADPNGELLHSADLYKGETDFVIRRPELTFWREKD